MIDSQSRATSGALSVNRSSVTRPPIASKRSCYPKQSNAAGVQCWISISDVAPGGNYQEAIERSLRSSGAMVLVFSDAANNSEEIKKELSLASRCHVPVMTLRIAAER